MNSVASMPYTVNGHKLDDQQMAAIMDDSPTQLVKGNAGTGKTETLIGKVKHLINQGVDGSEILVLTFSKNLSISLRSMVVKEGRGLWVPVRTIHSLGFELVGKKSGVDRRDDTIYSIVKGLETDKEYSDLVSSYASCLCRSKRNKLASYGVDIGEKELYYLYGDWCVPIAESIGEIISRVKSTNTTIDSLFKTGGSDIHNTGSEAEKLAALAKKVYEEYCRRFEISNLVDFEDMILELTDMLRRGTDFGLPYRWVLVDGYQDFSQNMVDLLKMLREKTKFNMFCTADERQSIYSFRGGDVRQISDFEKIWEDWGPVSVKTIQNVYRLPPEIVDASTRFIENQMRTSNTPMWNGDASTVYPIHVICYDDEGDIPELIANRLDFLDPNESACIIGRTRNDVDLVRSRAEWFTIDYDDEGELEYSNFSRYVPRISHKPLPYYTAHSSEGLEADNVFLIANSFPITFINDLDALFDSEELCSSYLEERRVFYVAMTRARRRLFILSRRKKASFDLGSINPFVAELLSNEPLKSLTKHFCPMCSTCFGPMVIKKRKDGGLFYSCFRYGKSVCKGGESFRGL